MRVTLTFLLLVFAASGGINISAQADALTIHSVGASSGKQTKERPQRGMSKVDVRKKFGDPAEEQNPVSKDAQRKLHHAISRWVYKDYAVFFADNHVIDTVTHPK